MRFAVSSTLCVCLLLLITVAPGVTAAKPTLLFDNITIGPVPHDAAFHHRAAVPEVALHLVTQVVSTLNTRPALY